MHVKFAIQRFREYLKYDATWLHWPLGFVLGVVGWLLLKFGQAKRGVALLCSLHRAALSPFSSRLAERIVQDAARAAAEGRSHAVLDFLEDYVKTGPINSSIQRLIDDPRLMLDSLAIVLKRSKPGEKGVLLIKYANAFLLFARRFDVNRVAEHYHIVIEPDWAGLCNPPVLCFLRYRFPVFVFAFEPRDEEFLLGLRSNLIPVRLSPNYWVDHRRFPIVASVEKEADLIMVAAWANYKRHHQFFRALAVLCRQGIRLKTILAGYDNGLTLDEVRACAQHYGVADQIEFHHNVPYDNVNELLQRAKINVLWSRKEGAPRAVIEGMFAGLPCVMCQDFNYGHHHAYINAATGRYASKRQLPATLAEMSRDFESYSPREWVMNNMTCHQAIEILAEAVRKVAAGEREAWTEGLVAKINKLNRMEYWEPGDRDRFSDDYQFLSNSTLCKPAAVTKERVRQSA